MQKNTTIITAVVVAVLIIAGVLYTQSQKGTVPSTPSTPEAEVITEPVSEGQTSTPSAEEETKVVTVTSSGFSPNEIKIKAGGTVTWTNSDSAVHAVNSAIHPTHQVYPPLNLGNIQAGGSATLTFPDAGTYKYHDHLNPSLTGSVTVE